jgi:RNA polymerase sigma-70 factor (ECF subfamily)
MVLDITTRFARDPDEAEDWAQDAWTLAFRRRRSFGGRGSIRGWLMALARNLCLSRLRRRRRLAEVLALFRHEPREPPPGPLERLEEADELQLLRRAIAELPKRQREAVTLKYGEDRNYSEIAEVMGISEPSVRSLISKGIARLEKELRRVE